ncbi:MAG TPA: gluconate 2-dehydrogenase subunit 3 family protein, partial [Tepidiformaceae bacterium]|nr:gluconate 2-dehydrogenase subunit 3 family protein [Tepidiformaceae bacterium]
MAYSFERADHLPRLRAGGLPGDPAFLPRQRRGVTPQMHGRYPDFNVLEHANEWDEVTRKLVEGRIDNVPPIRFFTPQQALTLTAFCDTVMAQETEPRIPVLNFVDERMFNAGTAGLDGYQYAGMPDDPSTWQTVAAGLDEEAVSRGYASFATAPGDIRNTICEIFSKGALVGGSWDGLSVKRAWNVVMRSILGSFYSHPWAWNEIGFGGPAYPEGYMRLGVDLHEPWERNEALDIDPAYIESVTGEGPAARPRQDQQDIEGLRRETHEAAAVAKAMCAHVPLREQLHSARHFLRGAIGPRDNDSRFLLDVHKRGIPGAASMRTYRDEDEVDMLIVGAGAGGSVLAQRLARSGWKVVILEAGPFWDPDRDWVSDEAGSQHIYWTQKRIIGGSDPVELGKNNSGRGVGGSMIHYAGYTPRFHPSDLETYRLDGVGADWPMSYDELRPHYEQVEAELPVAGQDWPWGYPHRYPHAAHPISGAAEVAVDGARRYGLQMRVGPVGIANGTFG